MQELLEEVERLAVSEDPIGDPFAIRCAVFAEDVLAEPLDERSLHLRIGREEVVDDLVARDGGSPVPTEAFERG
jgi:hypothetical protein